MYLEVYNSIHLLLSSYRGRFCTSRYHFSPDHTDNTIIPEYISPTLWHRGTWAHIPLPMVWRLISGYFFKFSYTSARISAYLLSGQELKYFCHGRNWVFNRPGWIFYHRRTRHSGSAVILSRTTPRYKERLNKTRFSRNPNLANFQYDSLL